MWFGIREITIGKELMTNQETIIVDGDRELIYVAYENRREVKVYDLDGKFQTTFGKGHFSAQVEGIVVAGCDRTGFFIASDQKSTTELEVFDRATFQHLPPITIALRIRRPCPE